MTWSFFPSRTDTDATRRAKTMSVGAFGIGILGIVAILAFALGRGCDAPAPDPVPVVVADVDAGPGEAEIARREVEERRRIEAELREVEAHYDDEIRGFDETQRAELGRVRREGREALARWLSEYNRGLRDAGVVAVDSGSRRRRAR